MSFKWRKFSIFGLITSIPVIIFLAKKISEEQEAAFEENKAKLQGCKRCQTLFPHYVMRLMEHLEDEHGLSEDAAIDTVQELYKRFKILQRAKQEKK